MRLLVSSFLAGLVAFASFGCAGSGGDTSESATGELNGVDASAPPLHREMSCEVKSGATDLIPTSRTAIAGGSSDPSAFIDTRASLEGHVVNAKARLGSGFLSASLSIDGKVLAHAVAGASGAVLVLDATLDEDTQLNMTCDLK